MGTGYFPSAPYISFGSRHVSYSVLVSSRSFLLIAERTNAMVRSDTLNILGFGRQTQGRRSYARRDTEVQALGFPMFPIPFFSPFHANQFKMKDRAVNTGILFFGSGYSSA